MKTLSISIPTYNRPQYLRELLEILCNQALINKVDINIFDNSDSNETEKLLENFSDYSNINYNKNVKNIGYVNNQIKCLESSNSKYTAFLCDDDIYIENAINTILKVLESEVEYSFIALNYYSFSTNYLIKKKSKFAPLNDVVFDRAYDILNYPSVGHFSGFIFNSKIAKSELNELKYKYGTNFSKEFEKHRGIITHLANLSLSKSNLPSYFIGNQILASREPDTVDYDLLYHLNYDNLKYYLGLYEDGIISKKDFNYKKKLVLDSLPKAIMIESSIKSRDEYNLIKKKFDKILINEFQYRFLIRPLFYISQNSLINFIWKIFYKYYKIFFK